ncbi:MAG: hypothetical protein KDD56_09970 [Bdellovibrionales bacterium]|nr:hypothetical protein [Bdellovibrionales bacterium]
MKANTVNACFVILTIYLANSINIEKRYSIRHKVDIQNVESDLTLDLKVPISSLIESDIELFDGISKSRAELVFKSLDKLCSNSSEDPTQILTSLKGIGKITAERVLKKIDLNYCDSIHTMK